MIMYLKDKRQVSHTKHATTKQKEKQTRSQSIWPGYYLLSPCKTKCWKRQFISKSWRQRKIQQTLQSWEVPCMPKIKLALNICHLCGCGEVLNTLKNNMWKVKNPKGWSLVKEHDNQVGFCQVWHCSGQPACHSVLAVKAFHHSHICISFIFTLSVTLVGVCWTYVCLSSKCTILGAHFVLFGLTYYWPSTISK